MSIKVTFLYKCFLANIAREWLIVGGTGRRVMSLHVDNHCFFILEFFSAQTTQLLLFRFLRASTMRILVMKLETVLFRKSESAGGAAAANI